MEAWDFSDLIDGLAGRQWAVRKGFLSPEEVRDLRADAEAREARGEFAPAGIGRAGGRAERKDIRGDLTRWWEEGSLEPAQRTVWDRLHAYRDAVNRELYLGLRALELHYAHYPPGSFYLRHVDTFRDSARRLVSCVLYLNEDWRPEDGGELVLYPDGAAEPVRILPEAGLLATFLSGAVPHEVLPNRRGRWSVTGWFGKEAV